MDSGFRRNDGQSLNDDPTKIDYVLSLFYP
jgi:hypothetical protein